MSGLPHVLHCWICGDRLHYTTTLCGPCMRPLPPDWQPKTEWGRARKAERDAKKNGSTEEHDFSDRA